MNIKRLRRLYDSRHDIKLGIAQIEVLIIALEGLIKYKGPQLM